VQRQAFCWQRRVRPECGFQHDASPFWRAPNCGSNPCIASTGEIIARTANDVYHSRWIVENRLLCGECQMTPPKAQFNWTDPDAYEIFMGRWSELLAKPFLALADVVPGGRVLNVACGTGVLSRAFANAGAHVTGVDASEGYLEGAHRRRSEAHARSGPVADEFSSKISLVRIR
jgi:2-polyprenyl-3-methyl-5-hydroxy-6-metoxy-1,4-benzoquinol methylase